MRKLLRIQNKIIDVDMVRYVGEITVHHNHGGFYHGGDVMAMFRILSESKDFRDPTKNDVILIKELLETNERSVYSVQEISDKIVQRLEAIRNEVLKHCPPREDIELIDLGEK